MPFWTVVASEVNPGRLFAISSARTVALAVMACIELMCGNPYPHTPNAAILIPEILQTRTPLKPQAVQAPNIKSGGGVAALLTEGLSRYP